MSSSGNGPTVITIAPNTFENDDGDIERTEESSGEVVTKERRWPNRAQRSKDNSDEDKPPRKKRPTLKEVLENDERYPWVLESKPVDDPLQMTLWWLYVHLRLFRTGMQPPKEVSYFRLRQVIDAILLAINTVREETATIIGVIAIKGGVGKTTISTWFAAAVAWATKLSVGIVDTDRGGGLVPSRFGLNKVRTVSGTIKRPLSIYELGKRIEAGEAFTQEKLISETLSDSKTGVMIYSAPAGQGMGVSRTQNMLRYTRSQHAGGVVVDTTPGLRVPMTNATAITSGVKIIVAQGLSDESIQGIRTALNFEPYELRKSIESVLVVIVALPVRKCNRRTAFELVDRLNLRPTKISERDDDESGEDSDDEDELVEVPFTERLQSSQIMFLPSDRYMDNHRVKELEPVMFTAARPRTQLALAQLVKAKDDIVLKQRAMAHKPTPVALGVSDSQQQTRRTLRSPMGASLTAMSAHPREAQQERKEEQ